MQKTRILGLFFFALAVVSAYLSAQIAPPGDVAGFPIGSDYKLADFETLNKYFRMLGERSDRFVVQEYGRSVEGRPMLLAIVTSPENHAHLERYRTISRRLALNQVSSDQEAKKLSREGKAVVWLDSGLHATEIATAQHALLLGHQLATRDDEEMRRILDNVILLFAPCVNPDGMQLVTTWYAKHQNLRIPELYQHYVGHDNNRDFIMATQPETQSMARVMYRDWIPQIVYNHHQQAPRGTAIFVPEYRGPFNFNIPPMIMRGINLVGAAMKMRFEEENKPGVISREIYSTWWNGGLRTAAYFHNQIGILTETGVADPAPRHIMPTDERLRPRTDYPHPLSERTWHLRDSIDYMLTASWGVLDVASRYPESFLHNIYLTGKRSIEEGRRQTPHGFVLSAEQRDPGSLRRLVNVLIRSGLRVERLTAPVRIEGTEYPAGSYLLDSAQPFRAHLLDMMTPQEHPHDVAFPGGPPVPPYDIAGWTLSLQMGVEAASLANPLDASVKDVAEVVQDEVEAGPDAIPDDPAWAYVFSPAANDSYAVASQLLQRGIPVHRLSRHSLLGDHSFEAGSFVVRSQDVSRQVLGQAAGRGLAFRALSRPSQPLPSSKLRKARVGLYDVYGGNMDSGWTRWIFEQYGIPYQRLWGQEIRQGDLNQRFDVIVLSSDIRIGTEGAPRRRRGIGGGPLPEGYEGRIPIGSEGIVQLRRFVEAGGRLVLMGGSSMVAVRDLRLPIRNVLAEKAKDGRYRAIGRDRFYCPGSLLEAEFDPSDPLAYGMPVAGIVFFRNSPSFEVTGEDVESVRMAGAYPDRNPLRSGWIWGERLLHGKGLAATISLGQGDVVLLGPRVQFRAQPHGTFKLLFNAVLNTAAEPDTLE